MVAEDILTELQDIMRNRRISKNDLMVILKKYAGIISAYDLMMATEYIRKDGKFIQAGYREKYLEIYIKYFLMRMKEVLVKDDYDKTAIINRNSFEKSLPLLKKTFETERMSSSSDDKLPLIYVITSLYTTFILEEPIHPVGSEFPGNL